MIGVEIMIGKDKILGRPRTDMDIATESVTIGKILVETTAGIEVEKTLGEIIVMTEVDQEKEAPHPEGMVICDITAQTQVQGLGVDLIQEQQQTEIGLDVLDAGSMIILAMNAQTWVSMIQMSMNQIVKHCN